MPTIATGHLNYAQETAGIHAKSETRSHDPDANAARPAAVLASSLMVFGVRCAELMVKSLGTRKRSRTSKPPLRMWRSELAPMTTTTRELVVLHDSPGKAVAGCAAGAALGRSCTDFMSRRTWRMLSTLLIRGATSCSRLTLEKREVAVICLILQRPLGILP